MKNTREKVIEAATEVFTSKGFGSARMQEIADHAGINKGLLHYYFKSKENLFHEVIKTVANKIVPKLDFIINSDDELSVKIGRFVEFYIDLLIDNPYLPAFVLAELNMNGELFAREMLGRNQVNPMKIILQIQMEIQEGKIKPVNPFDLLLNVLSMCIFPFIARPIFKEVTGLTEEDYLKLMQQRKNELTAFILNAIKP
jgi:AcrR family transcriptional regulator